MHCGGPAAAGWPPAARRLSAGRSRSVGVDSKALSRKGWQSVNYGSAEELPLRRTRAIRFVHPFEAFPQGRRPSRSQALTRSSFNRISGYVLFDLRFRCDNQKHGQPV